MTNETKSSLYKAFLDIANIFAVISVPIGIYIAAMLMQLSNDVAVIKSQLLERERDREKLERLYNEVIELKTKLYYEQNKKRE